MYILHLRRKSAKLKQGKEITASISSPPSHLRFQKRNNIIPLEQYRLWGERNAKPTHLTWAWLWAQKPLANISCKPANYSSSSSLSRLKPSWPDVRAESRCLWTRSGWREKRRRTERILDCSSPWTACHLFLHSQHRTYEYELSKWSLPTSQLLTVSYCEDVRVVDIPAWSSSSSVSARHPPEKFAKKETGIKVLFSRWKTVFSRSTVSEDIVNI